MNRLQIFESLALHTYYRPVFSKLTTMEVATARDLLKKFSGMDANDFSIAANRLWLDQVSPERPKNYRLIIELLTVANSLSLKGPSK